MAYDIRICTSCGKEKPLNNYYPSKNIHHALYVPICKDCVTRNYKDNLKALDNNEAVAVWATLSEIGYPFINEVWVATDSALEEAKTKPGAKKLGISVYLSFFADYADKTGMKDYAFWQSDTMLDELKPSEEKRAEFYKSKAELIIDWGKYKEDADEVYAFLEYTFNEYTRGLEDMTPAQVNRYRDLCRAEWRKRKAEEEGSNKDAKDIQAEIKSLMEMLKINNFQEDNSKDEVHKLIEYRIWEIENTRPAECEDLEKYRDYCGSHSLLETLMRPFRNLIAGTREYPNITPTKEKGK